MSYRVKMKKSKGIHEQFYGYKNYKNFSDLQKDIRKNGLKDYFKVNGVLYTQQEYDASGKQVSYGNKRTGTGFIVNTEDRYNNGYADAEIEYFGKGDWYFRNDISYID